MSDAPFLVPKERYTSPAFHALEWERLWTKSWLLAGRSADLEKVGDYFVFEIGGESIVVVKSGPDSVHAFYNVCPHRGTRLVSEARGSFECVRCPYHAWEWRLDGRLKRVSDAGSFPPGTKASELSLYAVQAATWLGFVFVNLDPDAEPLAASLSELTPLLEPYLLERHVLVRDVTVEWDCNWKVCMDNSNETYHVQSVHPQLLELLDDQNTPARAHGDHSSFVVRLGAPSHRLGALADPPVELRRLLEKFGLDPGRFSGRLPEVRPELSRALRQKLASQGTPYPDLDDAALIDNLHVHVFPNVMFNVMLPGYWLFRARPHESDPNRMLFDFQEYERVPEDRPRPRPRHTRHRHGEVSLDAVLDQDARIMHEAQRGLRSSAAGPLRLGAQEERLRHFHEVLARRTGPRAS